MKTPNFFVISWYYGIIHHGKKAKLWKKACFKDYQFPLKG